MKWTMTARKRPWLLGALFLVATVVVMLRSDAVRHRGNASWWPGRPKPSKTSADSTFQDPQFVDQIWDSLCARQNWDQFPQQSRPRKVYDLFLLNTELDWLEVRLHTLAPHVDYFVIVESPYTFTGHPKPLFLKENWDRFRQFHDKIIHRVIDGPRGADAWTREKYLRTSLLTQVFPELEGTPKEAFFDDVLMVSDTDEIPKPITVATLRHCTFPLRTTLQSRFYYYSFQWHHVDGDWHHPQATSYRGLEDTLSPEHLRADEGSTHKEYGWMNNASWHCSSCFSTIKETQTKINSFSHEEWNTDENKDEATLIERFRNGLDIFARPDETYERIEPNPDVPAYIVENADRFGYLLDRDGSNAGFLDVPL